MNINNYTKFVKVLKSITIHVQQFYNLIVKLFRSQKKKKTIKLNFVVDLSIHTIKLIGTLNIINYKNIF